MGQGATPPTPLDNDEPKKALSRPTYPDVRMYDGKDPKEYAAFRTNLKIKFLMDAHYFHSEEMKTYYAFSRLEGIAS